MAPLAKRPARAVRGLVTLGMLLMTVVGPGPAPAVPSGTSLALSVPTGPPSTRTVVSGTGFGALEVIDLTFDGRAVGAATTDDGGSFSRKIRVPAEALPGDHQVVGTGRTSGRKAEATFTVRTDWPMERFDARGSAFNTSETLLSRATVGGLVPAWSADFGVHDPPVVAGGLLYVTDREGVHAVDASTGAFVWTADPGGNSHWSGVSAGWNAVFTASTGGRLSLWSLDASTGVVVWEAEVEGGNGITRPVPAGDMVFLATHVTTGDEPGTLHAYDAATGTERWSRTSEHRFSVPAIVGGVVYTHTTGTVFALDGSTGAVLWESQAGSVVPDERTTVADGMVFAATEGGDLDAFDAETGELRWSVRVGTGLGPGVAVADGRVYASFGRFDVRLTAIEAATGSTLWTVPYLVGFTEASPTAANGVVYMAGAPEGIYDSGLYALDAVTGEQLWTAGVGVDPLYSSATVVNGMVYVTIDELGHPGYGHRGGPSVPPLVAFGLTQG
jgi:outer membrane protein assembly factor BamB